MSSHLNSGSTGYINPSFDDLELSAKTLENLLISVGRFDLATIGFDFKEILDIIRAKISVKSTYALFTRNSFKISDSVIYLNDVQFLIEKIVHSQIRNSDYLFFYLLTIGDGLEKLSKKFSIEGDLLNSYLFDFLASEIVEIASDKLMSKLKELLPAGENNLTNRFSPGYCGWNITEQQKLFGLFPKKNIGISLSNSSLMNPVKSVSGIVGCGKEVEFKDYYCDFCNFKDCYKRKLKENQFNG